MLKVLVRFSKLTESLYEEQEEQLATAGAWDRWSHQYMTYSIQVKHPPFS